MGALVIRESRPRDPEGKAAFDAKWAPVQAEAEERGQWTWWHEFMARIMDRMCHEALFFKEFGKSLDGVEFGNLPWLDQHLWAQFLWGHSQGWRIKMDRWEADSQQRNR